MLTSEMFQALVSSASIAPYTGPWTAIEAGHLLRRTTFSPLKTEIDEAVNLGLEETITTLLTLGPPPSPPLYYDYDAHPDLSIGETWVDHHTNPNDANNDGNARRRSLDAWWMLTSADTGINIREKMCFFWHNHFGMGGNNDARGIYQFLAKYQQFAIGNFRDLVKEITIDPMMLRFLNGHTSTAANPNENFAREILELFTIGKGPQTGTDYTNYTELDVVELAKAFTGWRSRYIGTKVPGQAPESYFTENRHDTSTKTLSHRFNFAEIPNAGIDEYKNVVDLIFQQDEVSRFICRKLYRYFVYYKIDESVESGIIEPMAQTLRNNDYTIGPALVQLLSSEHFYDRAIVGDVIKSPLDFVHSIFKAADFYDQGNLIDDYEAGRRAFIQVRNMGMDLRQPPSVAGWTSYYQEPSYFRLWLNTATLKTRTDLVVIALRRNGFSWNGDAHPFNWLGALTRYDNPGEPNGMIAQMTAELLPQPLVPEQIAALKELLLPGLQDFVWSGEYANHLANPNDDNLRASVENRLKEMVSGLLQLAEFQVH
ncbi:DUF1800 domain-containing protein [Neolewinella persica]|uniref:DUF1800 domain-containing protein n=1 Tax=Neolewinella persica TaxID=70998 RepID=UPI00036D0EC0|nr:DUF1800 domain-containing protein [Neolewinella persica]